MSRRKMDMGAEQQLSKFLDTYFYPWMKQDYKYDISRILDKEWQLKGVDVIVKTKSRQIYVDEKAQLYYINENLPTFAFEINFMNKQGNLSQGWLFNNDLITEYYLLIWPYAKCKNLKLIKAKDFTELDCLMIQREKIQKFLINKGWPSQRLYEEAQKLRSYNQYGKTKIKNETEFYFYYSNPKYYKEQPVNVIIRKGTLIELADQRYKVSRDDVIKQKLRNY